MINIDTLAAYDPMPSLSTRPLSALIFM